MYVESLTEALTSTEKATLVALDPKELVYLDPEGFLAIKRTLYFQDHPCMVDPS
jgi:hypothetical protein